MTLISAQPITQSHSFGKRVVRITSYAVLGTWLIESPLRYGLHWLGAEFLIYLRDAALLLIIGYALSHEILARCLGILTVTLVVFGAHFCAGLLQHGDLARAAMGFKLFFPFVAGLAMGPHLSRRALSARAFALAWLIVSLGILLDWAFELPWQGLRYTVLGQEVEANRLWTTGGVERVSGFARQSYEAASQLLLAACGLVILQRPLFGALVIIATLALIALTTSKGVFLAGSFVWLSTVMRGVTRSTIPQAVILSMVATSCIIMPWLAVADMVSVRVACEDMIFGSLSDRIRNTWPDAIAHYERSSRILGGGLGAVGVGAGVHGATNNPGDNLFLYLLASCGPAAAAYLIVLAAGGLALRDARADRDRFLFLAVLSGFVIGLTANVVEATVLPFTLGCAAAVAARRAKASS